MLTAWCYAPLTPTEVLTIVEYLGAKESNTFPELISIVIE
jgi:hypothetical protein